MPVDPSQPRPATDPAELCLFALAARLFGAGPDGGMESVATAGGAAARALAFGGGRGAVVLSRETSAPIQGAA